MLSLRRIAHSTSLRATGSWMRSWISVACGGAAARAAEMAFLAAATSMAGVLEVGACAMGFGRARRLPPGLLLQSLDSGMEPGCGLRLGGLEAFGLGSGNARFLGGRNCQRCRRAASPASTSAVRSPWGLVNVRFSPAQRRSRYRLVFSVDKIDEALTPPGRRPSAATAAKTGQVPLLSLPQPTRQSGTVRPPRPGAVDSKDMP